MTRWAASAWTWRCTLRRSRSRTLWQPARETSVRPRRCWMRIPNCAVACTGCGCMPSRSTISVCDGGAGERAAISEPCAGRIGLATKSVRQNRQPARLSVEWRAVWTKQKPLSGRSGSDARHRRLTARRCRKRTCAAFWKRERRHHLATTCSVAVCGGAVAGAKAQAACRLL